MLSVVASIWAQGSLGAGGGGGFGGGGGSAGRAGDDGSDPNQEIPEQFRQPPEAGWPIAWQKRNAILSPGDRVEYKIKLAADEVLLAVATSSSFDPALDVTREKTSVAKNDDRREGDQSSFINFRARVAGEYSLNVVSYSKSAGGQFTLQYFVLTRVDLGLEPPSIQGRRLTVHRLALEKGKTYRVAFKQEGLAAYPASIIGPSGNWADDFDLISPLRSIYQSRTVFTAKKTGDFLLRFSEVGEGAVLQVGEVPVYNLEMDATSSFKVARGGLAVVVTNVRSELPMVSRVPSVLRIEARLITEPSEAEAHAPDGRGFRRFVSLEGSEEVGTYLFPKPGKWRRLVENLTDGDGEFTISNSTSIPAFANGTSISERLAIGQARAFLYKAQPGEISHVGVSTEEFSPTLDLYSLQGQSVNSLKNPSSSNVSSELYFPTGGEYLVVLRCFGNGGSGKFTLARKELPVRTLKLGVSLVIPANSPTVDTGQIQLEANTDYEFVFGPSRQPPFQILTADYVATGQLELLDRTVTSFRVAKSGLLRLWFPRSSVDQPFEIRKVSR